MLAAQKRSKPTTRAEAADGACSRNVASRSLEASFVPRGDQDRLPDKLSREKWRRPLAGFDPIGFARRQEDNVGSRRLALRVGGNRSGRNEAQRQHRRAGEP